MTLPEPPDGRIAGLVLLCATVALLALLANHPMPAQQSFADLLRSESDHQVVDGFVHGGFIAVLSVQLAALVVYALRSGIAKPLVLTALLAAAFGAGFLALSMVLDGFVTPAVASRYLAAPEKADSARALFVLLGAMLRVLMPLGLLFQCASVLLFSIARFGTDATGRMVGVTGIAIGALVVAALAWSAAAGPHVLIGALVALGLWHALVGASLVARRL